jgi:hypothetical protein
MTTKAEELLNYLTDLGGFDDWWDSIAPDIQAEILDEIAAIINA